MSQDSREQAPAVQYTGDRSTVAAQRDQIAAMLCDFRPSAEHRWATHEEALAEVDESLQDDRPRASIVAIAGGRAVGWVAGYRTYDHAFELHPLVVDHAWQGRGVGRRLVALFEDHAAAAGALTVYLGSDDTSGRTSLGGEGLFGAVLARAGRIRDVGGHPLGFYVRCGYEVVGVLPDVNGLGKPDIWLAKPVGRG